MTISSKIKKRLRARANCCAICERTIGELGGRNVMTIDHVIPRSKGGPNAQWNLRVACKACNKAKADNMPDNMPWQFDVEAAQ